MLGPAFRGTKETLLLRGEEHTFHASLMSSVWAMTGHAHHISMRKDGLGGAASLERGLQLSALAPVGQPQGAQERRRLLDHMHRRAGLRQGGQPMLQAANRDLQYISATCPEFAWPWTHTKPLQAASKHLALIEKGEIL